MLDALNVFGRQRNTSLGYDYLVKLLLIGDSGVGKSCMLLRFVEEDYKPKSLATVGIDFKMKILDVDGQRVKLQIWDTAGQERFRTITQYIREWMDQIDTYAEKDVKKVLVGNKADLEREVSESDSRELAVLHGLDHIETSAVTGQNVNGVFIFLTRLVVESLRKAEEELNANALKSRRARRRSADDSKKTASSSSAASHAGLLSRSRAASRAAASVDSHEGGGRIVLHAEEDGEGRGGIRRRRRRHRLEDDDECCEV